LDHVPKTFGNLCSFYKSDVIPDTPTNNTKELEVVNDWN